MIPRFVCCECVHDAIDAEEGHAHKKQSRFGDVDGHGDHRGLQDLVVMAIIAASRMTMVVMVVPFWLPLLRCLVLVGSWGSRLNAARFQLHCHPRQLLQQGLPN